jgi:hypothetical protein
MVLPKQKLAFCRIPKVASFEFTRMFNKANHYNADGLYAQMKREDYFNFSAPGYFAIDESTMKKANGWKFAFFMRDPIDRYASAFMSKCVPAAGTAEIEGQGVHCFGETVPHPASKEAVVTAFERRVLSDMSKGKVADNPHWLKQSTVLNECGEHFQKGSADFIGSLSGDMNAQVKEMIRMISPQGLAVRFELADLCFPAGAIAGHETANVTVTKHDLLRDPYIERALRQMFADDYKIFCRVSECDPQEEMLLNMFSP